MYHCVGEQSEPKMSNCTCFTNSNPNIFLCRQAKRARKFQMIVVLPIQILMYDCVGEQSEPKKCQIVLVLPTQILIYYCVDEQSKPKNFK